MAFQLAAVNAQQLLAQDTFQLQQAELFVEFYRLLFKYKDDDGVAMRHWLRSEIPALGGSPHKLIVDDDRCTGVISHL